jgi:hypothetical protein
VPAESKKADWKYALSEDGTTEFTLPVNGVMPFLNIIPACSETFSVLSSFEFHLALRP